MAAMNSWLSFPMCGSPNHDPAAIRRFCPPGVEQEQRGDQWEVAGNEIDEMWCPIDTTSTPLLPGVEQEQGGDQWEVAVNEIDEMWCPTDTTSTPLLAASVEEDFVDGFINMDFHDNMFLGLTDQDGTCPNFQVGLENVSMPSDVYLPNSMMVGGGDHELEMCSCLEEDFGVVPEKVAGIEVAGQGVDQGLHLVHLLLACAEAVGCRDTQVAASLLGQIWAWVNPWGDSLQRVCYCFALGLESRLTLFDKSNANANANAKATLTNGAIETSPITLEDKREAFQLLHQTTPYIAFGLMAANEAIAEAAHGIDSLHIIDLGMEHTLQWPSLISTLATRPQGPPKLVRITGILGHHEIPSELGNAMKGLIDGAASLGIALDFQMLRGPVTPWLLSKDILNLRDGEALFVNSIMHLHRHVQENRGSLKTVLQAIKNLSPSLVTVVEQDANHNGPFFLGRFLESLHYYSAIFDSLEASLPRNSPQRMKIEKLHFAEEIKNIVGCEGSNRVQRHEGMEQWRRQLRRAGFEAVELKCLSQVRTMVSSVYGSDGYILGCDRGCLLLGWKERPIMLASAWQVHSASSF